MPNEPTGQAGGPALPPFLTKVPWDLVHPARRELRGILADQYCYRDLVLALLRATSLKPAYFTLDTSAELTWLDILGKTAARGRMSELLGAVLDDEGAAAWHARLRELIKEHPVVPAASAGSLEWKAPPPGNERLMGPESTLLDVAFLETGVERSRAVVRILASFGDVQMHGTGFLISPRHVLTNHHVLFDHEGNPATGAAVWLNHELAPDGKPAKVDEYTGDTGSIRADAPDDWALLPLRERLRRPVTPIRLAEPSRPVVVGDRVYIVQHPRGGYKRIGMHHNRVTSCDPARIQYLTDTEAGSSGSPVFNDRWELVALHHRWINVAKKGAPSEYRNQGIHVGRVVAGLPDLVDHGSRGAP